MYKHPVMTELSISFLIASNSQVELAYAKPPAVIHFMVVRSYHTTSNKPTETPNPKLQSYIRQWYTMPRSRTTVHLRSLWFFSSPQNRNGHL